MKEQEEFKVPDNFPVPLGARVLIKEVQQEETKTAGGIIIGAGVKQLQDCAIGIVYAIGQNINIPIQLGMRVAFHKNANMVVYHKGIAYLHMYQDELYCTVPEDTRFEAKVADNEEKRRESNMDVTKRITEDANNKVDLLQNKDEMPKNKTIILPGK